MSGSGKEHISLVVTGHVDADKSTTCGPLIFKLRGVSDREMAKLQALAEEKTKSSFSFGYYLDTNKEERERGVTIQSNVKEFFTDTCHYIIVDAPPRPQTLHQEHLG
jgi:translation elongation factor EF-1alpha